MDSAEPTVNSSGERVFERPTLAGLTLATGADLVGFHDDGQHVRFTLQNLPDRFDELHRAGELWVNTRDAEKNIDIVVGMIRSQVRLRERSQLRSQAEMNREALAKATVGDSIGASIRLKTK